jgi:hypothetical protein
MVFRTFYLPWLKWAVNRRRLPPCHICFLKFDVQKVLAKLSMYIVWYLMILNIITMTSIVAMSVVTMWNQTLCWADKLSECDICIFFLHSVLWSRPMFVFKVVSTDLSAWSMHWSHYLGVESGVTTETFNDDHNGVQRTTKRSVDTGHNSSGLFQRFRGLTCIE